MKLFGDYHTHTIYSHGSGTIRDNVEAGIKKGLKEIAICDHGPGHYLYGVKKKKLPKMREEIDRLNEEYSDKDIRILLGVEANITGFDGTIDMDEKSIGLTDILLLGYHYGVTPNTLKDGLGLYLVNPITKLIPIGRDKALRMNTDAFIKAINKYPITFITHPGAKVPLDIRGLSRAAKKVGTCLEINAKHGELSVESIRIAMEENVDFYVNSDAHSPNDVGNVNASIERALAAGLQMQRIRNIIVD